MKATDPVARFNSRVQHAENGCWLWQGASVNGRGQLSVNGKNMLATRFAYQQFKGAIPDGMYVCHTCDDPRCVNPDHLWLGTARENAQDGIAKGRMAQNIKSRTCKQGHEFTGKDCRECHKARERARRVSRHEEVATLKARIAELEAALHALRDAADSSDDARYGTLGTDFVRSVVDSVSGNKTEVPR